MERENANVAFITIRHDVANQLRAATHAEKIPRYHHAFLEMAEARLSNALEWFVDQGGDIDCEETYLRVFDALSFVRGALNNPVNATGCIAQALYVLNHELTEGVGA